MREGGRGSRGKEGEREKEKGVREGQLKNDHSQ